MKRQVALRMTHFTSAPFVVAASDLIATVPLGLARTASRYVALRHLSPPLPLPEIAGFLCWHARAHADPGHAWFRQDILATRDRLQADVDGRH